MINKYIRLVFFSVTAFFTVIQVNAQGREFDINGWVGENDTLLSFPGDSEGVELYRSAEENCDIDNYGACTMGQFDTIGSQDVVDTVLNLSSPEGYYVLKDGSQQIEKYITFTGKLGAGGNHEAVVFNGKIWVIGGSLTSSDRKVWSSSDGITWKEEVHRAPFGGREGHQVVAFKNKIFLIGGRSKNSAGEIYSRNDIWSSVDGVNWVEESKSADFDVRSDHQVVVFNNKMWLLGGRDYQTFKGDIWSSEDGINWTEISENSALGGRASHEALVYKNRLWVVGGQGSVSTPNLNDIWSSADGSNWTLETNSAEFPGVQDHQMTVFNEQLYLIGGSKDDGSLLSMWSSHDGVHWSIDSELPQEAYRQFHQVVVMNQRLHIIGGGGKVVSSNNLRDWEVNSTGPNLLSGSHASRLIEFKEKLFSVGYTGVYSTVDGLDWEHIADPGFTPILLNGAIVFQEKLWVIDRSRIWSSGNGTDWTLESESPDFGSRHSISLTVHDNRLWLIGGYQGHYITGNYKNDIWSSVDGVNWNLEKVSAEFSPRGGHRAISFQGRIFLIGGLTKSGGLNDIWSSIDGINWVEEKSSAAFPARSLYPLFVFNDLMWIIGGSGKKDIWSSSDGIDWTHEGEGPFPKITASDIEAFDNKVWMIAPGEEVWSSNDAKDWRLGYRHSVELTEAKYYVSAASLGVVDANASEQGRGGTFSSETTVTLPGDIVSVEIIPDEGYEIYDATGCNGSLNGSTYTTGRVNSNCTIGVRFSKNYEARASAIGSGSISPEYTKVR